MNRRDTFLLIESSLTANRGDYARVLAQAWLAKWPGDLSARFYLAKAYALDKQTDDAAQPSGAARELTTITSVDFEHAEAHRLLGQLAKAIPSLDWPTAHATAHVLSGAPLPPHTPAPAWMEPAREAVRALNSGQYHVARQFAGTALLDSGAPPLVSLILVKAHWLAGDASLALPLAEGFHERWPKCVALILCLAEGLFRIDQPHRAVELLHRASALDPAGDVVSRYWGASHQYLNLWPRPITITLPGPIPSDVANLMGMNRLKTPTSNLQSPTSKPGDKRYTSKLYTPYSNSNFKNEELRDIQSQLNAVASKLGQARYYRRPVHVILYSNNLLFAKFGPQGSADIIGLIQELGAETAKHRGLPVILLAPDDESTLASFSLDKVQPTNPWAIKMMLHDIDRQLIRRGRAIGSLLIIGGDDLLPFHRLPNPTDDVDDDVPSDNPYGSTDDNYFIPEWPVGRLPSPCGRDPEPLCRLLRHTIAAHRASAPNGSWLRRGWGWLFARARFWRRSQTDKPSAIGYAANIWKEASHEVFEPIGPENDLYTSPPLSAANAPDAHKLEFSYFNLHGVEDGADWFGQRDLADGLDGPTFPLALRPIDVLGDGSAPSPKFVFTEACYGANILEKAVPDAAMCLRFLDSGALALVGSTKISYGSVSTPLIGADLLGRLFWENLLIGLSAGEALRRAKLYLAQTMHKRQNFLDGEDQKTLISFVLYGDPLLASRKAPSKKQLAKGLPSVETKAMAYESGLNSEIKPEAVAEIKSLVARYLPGAESAEVRLSRPLTPLAAKGAANRAPPTHRVYTLTHFIRFNAHTQPAFARITVNKAGKVMKVAISK
jgi:hypothetical protein